MNRWTPATSVHFLSGGDACVLHRCMGCPEGRCEQIDSRPVIGGRHGTPNSSVSRAVIAVPTSAFPWRSNISQSNCASIRLLEELHVRSGPFEPPPRLLREGSTG